MTRKCDHTSVGAIISNAQGELLMFQRGTPPWGIAGPSGHCDGDSYEYALAKEVWEEVGLTVVTAELLTMFTVNKACRRPYDGDPYHVWQFFRAEVTGTILPSERETEGGVRWYGAEEIERLMQRAEQYHLLGGTISEEAYRAQPGLDLSWFYLFKKHPELLLPPSPSQHLIPRGSHF